ncbi:MAG TPA: methylenetetrahydrofolate reductase C-terminal domain-containing protein [Syntrophorhabdaceae bacterium]|nr:methylenetetrahydrofolate reductase C-terminal domain-containing protein [Syntrophorhabdaceae bacterium]
MPENEFRKTILSGTRFIYTVELVPGKGSKGKAQEDVLRFAREAAAANIIHAVSITDNAGGHPALAPDVLGQEIGRLGISPIVHFTCKDKNRNQMESILYAFDRLNIQNVLVMTGDYPQYGFEGKTKPVFDIDSVQTLRLIRQMNSGLAIEDKAPGGGLSANPTNAFAGCVVSPFKKLESETMSQYYKLSKKVREGAAFLITQVGYDIRKYEELLRWMRDEAITIPILGNVYILNLPVAKAMNLKKVPGCVVTDELYLRCAGESRLPDKGRSAALARAAKQIAVLRGIGYNGVHIGGPQIRYDEVEWVIKESEELAANWRSFIPEFDLPIPNGYYVYEKDQRTGLSTGRVLKTRSPQKSPAYACMRSLHRGVFLPEAPLYGKACSIFRYIEGSRLEKLVTELEYWIKLTSSRCRRCGDCTLPEVAFLCPQSQCPKFLFNGQCGGSTDGWCEVFPGRRLCVYVRAYNRYKAYGEEGSLRNRYVRPRDWALDQTSSWINYFLGRDHYKHDCRSG